MKIFNATMTVTVFVQNDSYAMPRKHVSVVTGREIRFYVITEILFQQF